MSSLGQFPPEFLVTQTKSQLSAFAVMPVHGASLPVLNASVVQPS